MHCLHDIGVARGPVLAHGEAGELVVLGVVLVALCAVDELHDVEAHAIRAQRIHHLAGVRIVAQLGRQLLHQPRRRRSHAPALNVHIGVEARAARVANVFFPVADALHGFRQRAARRKEIDLEDGSLA